MASSTEFSFGLEPDQRPSSRVLKPPGGGHTNLFGEAEVKPNPPRPKYNQQNSSNLNDVMNTVDPNISMRQTCQDGQAPKDKAPRPPTDKPSPTPVDNGTASNNGSASASRGRVPPGGYSSGGFW